MQVLLLVKFWHSTSFSHYAYFQVKFGELMSILVEGQEVDHYGSEQWRVIGRSIQLTVIDLDLLL